MANGHSVTELIHDLRDPVWQVRYHAADRLKVVGDKNAVPPLLGVLKDDNLTVRFIAAMTLGIIRDERAILPLVQMLHDNDDPDVLWGATWALTEIGRPATMPLIQALAKGNATARDAAAEVLGRVNDLRAVIPLGWAFCQRGVRDFSVTRRFGAADALEQYGEQAVPMLEIAIRHPMADIRARAALALGRIGSAKAVSVLIVLLDDNALVRSGECVSHTARQALRRIGTPAARAALAKTDDKP